MPTERPCRRKLTQLVTDHILRDVDGNELLAVVNGQRVPHHFRNDGRTTRPGLHYCLATRFIHDLDLSKQVFVYERSLLQRSRHSDAYLLPRRRTMNLLVRLLFLVL